MPRLHAWLVTDNATILRMRLEGASWDAIAAAIGVCRWTAICRGEAIGAPRERPTPGIATTLPLQCHDNVDVDIDRDPLPPGHPCSWGALIAGTCLEGAAYSHPVYI
jgi:hypothetical protein